METEIKLSGCISNTHIIKYFVQVFFAFTLVVFCIVMIIKSNKPQEETLWISLLTSTMTLFINPPKLEKSN
jgi:RsiW-degrading membrane proteinase PrsW (M82 family)